MFEELTPDAFAAEVLFLRAQAPHSSIILLEGDSDVRLFDHLLDVDASNLVNCFGRENVHLTMSIVENEQIGGVLAIIDADFAKILNITYSSPNIVISDYHDFEMVLLNSSALDRLLIEDGSREKIDRIKSETSIRELLISACLPIGCLRFYSMKTSSNLKFKGIRYRHLGRKLEVNLDELIKEVFDNSRIHTGQEKAKAFINGFSFAAVDHNQLVNGHDVLAALGIALQSLIGTRNAIYCSAPELEAKLRMAFSLADFSLNSGVR